MMRKTLKGSVAPPVKQLPIDAISYRTVEADAHLGAGKGVNWATITGDEGSDSLRITLTGDAVLETSTGATHGRRAASISVRDVDDAEAFGHALIRAARKAKQIGLRALSEKEHFEHQQARRGA